MPAGDGQTRCTLTWNRSAPAGHPPNRTTHATARPLMACSPVLDGTGSSTAARSDKPVNGLEDATGPGHE